MTETTLDLVYQDELTGLYNRRFFNKRFSEMEALAAEGRVDSFAIAVIDVDHFKAINDHYGHLDGDELLRQVADVYKRHADEGVVPIRYAGDEFVLLMEGVDKARAVEIAHSICRGVASREFSVNADAPRIKVTNSIGVAHFPTDTTDVRKLFEMADHASMHSKRQGRNRVSTCDVAEDMVDKDSLYRRFPCPRLVGRGEIVTALEHTMPPRVAEAPPLVVLEGEGGHGKTRLITHLQQRADSERTLILHARGAPALVRQPFGMLCAALNRFSKEDPVATPLLAGALSDSERAEISRFIPSMLMYAAGPALEVPQAERKEALLGGFVAILRKLVSRKGLAVFFDDAHFLDWGTLQVLQRFADSEDERQALILLSFRPGADGVDLNPHLSHFLTWAREKQKLTHYLVEPLFLDEVVEMVEAILPRLDRPLDLATALFHRSEGVPLFIEELIKFLIHRDRIRIEGKDLRLEAVTVEDLPSNVSEAFQGRSDDLDEEVRSILSAAAVLGPEFNIQVLSRLEGKDEAYIAHVLDRARRAQLIRTETDDTYDFLFSDQQAAFYESLDAAERRKLHGKAGQLVEEFSGGDVDGSASELAFHYEQAGESQRAIDYATRLTQTYADLTAPGEVTAWARLLPDAKEWGVEAPLADDDMKLAQKLARVLKTSIQNFRIFPANSEILVDTRDAAYEDLARLLEITESLTYSDAGDNMVINGREPLLGAFERNPVAELMAVLGRSGLKGISFRRGLTDDEIFHFLELLAQRPDEIRDQGGWTEILKRDNFEHIIVNERVYVSMSERELLEGKAGLVMPLGKDDAALQELVELIRNEGDTLRSQLLGSDAFKSRLDQLVKAVRGDSTPVVADASGLPPWLVGKKRGVGGHSPEEEQMDFLAEIWEDLVVLFKELESGSRQRANSATRILLSRGKEVVNPLFQFIKSSDDLRARKIAVKIVERFDPEVRNRLLREIRDTQQSDERLRMISLLEGYNTNDVLTTLQPSLHAQQRELRREAIRIVEAHGSTQAESLLVKAMQSEYEPVKLDAISALGRMGRNTAVPELIKVLKPSSVFADEKYVEAQCEACAALGRLKDKSAIPALARVLKRRWPFPLSLKRTKPSPVRAAAAAALGQFSDDSTRRVLERHTRDRDVAVRSVAKLVLGGETANLALE